MNIDVNSNRNKSVFSYIRITVRNQTRQLLINHSEHKVWGMKHECQKRYRQIEDQ